MNKSWTWLFGDPEVGHVTCPISGAEIMRIDEHGSFCNAEVCECAIQAIQVDLDIHFTEHPCPDMYKEDA